MIPASVGLIVLREPIIHFLFERNQFDALSTSRAATTLMYYCIGLFAYSAAKILIPCFYSLKDTRTPVRIVTVAVVVNLVLNLVLMQFLEEGGLALATSITGILELVLLFWFLRRKIGAFDGLSIGWTGFKALLASLLMGAVAIWAFRWAGGIWELHTIVPKGMRVAIPFAAGVVTYLISAWALKLEEVTGLIRRVLGQKA